MRFLLLGQAIELVSTEQQVAVAPLEGQRLRGAVGKLLRVLTVAVLIAACGSKDDTVGDREEHGELGTPSRLGSAGSLKPIFGDQEALLVLDAGTSRVLSYDRAGNVRWEQSLAEHRPYLTCVGSCAQLAISSDSDSWPDASRQDASPTFLRSSGRRLPWPTSGSFIKYRIVAATSLGSGVVVTSDGQKAAVRIQANHRYLQSAELESSLVEWHQSVDGSVGAIFDYGRRAGQTSSVVVVAREGGRWRLVSKRTWAEPVFAVFLSDDPGRYVLGRESEYRLISGASEADYVAEIELSDLALYSHFNIELLRRMGSEGDRTTANVVDRRDGRSLFQSEYHSAATVSVSGRLGGVLLSSPGATHFVTSTGARQVPGEGRYLAVTDGGFWEIVDRVVRYRDSLP